jgi:hypothetical protein
MRKILFILFVGLGTNLFAVPKPAFIGTYVKTDTLKATKIYVSSYLNSLKIVVDDTITCDSVKVGLIWISPYTLGLKASISQMSDSLAGKQDTIGIITSSVDNKYLRKDGTWNEIEPPSGGYANNIYYSNIASSYPPTYLTLSYNPDVSAVVCTTSVTNDTVLANTYMYTKGVATTLYPSGLWSFSFYGKVSSAAGISKIMVTYFKRNANVKTDLFSVWSSEINNTTDDWIQFVSTQPSFVTLETDTMGAEVWVYTDGSAKDIMYMVGNGYASYLATPNRIRHSQLRDLNGDTLYQHVKASDTLKWDNYETNKLAKNDSTGTGAKYVTRKALLDSITNRTVKLVNTRSIAGSDFVFFKDGNYPLYSGTAHVLTFNGAFIAGNRESGYTGTAIAGHSPGGIGNLGYTSTGTALYGTAASTGIGVQGISFGGLAGKYTTSTNKNIVEFWKSGTNSGLKDAVDTLGNISITKDSIRVGGILKKFITDSSNVDTVNTSAYRYYIPAKALITDGNSIHFKYVGVYKNTISLKWVNVYFNDTCRYDSYGNYYTQAVDSCWIVEGDIIRVSSTTAKFSVTNYTSGASLLAPRYKLISNLNFNNLIKIHITLDTDNTDGKTNDLTAKYGIIEYKP